MARLLGIQVQNYKVLREVKLGRLRPSEKVDPLPSLACFIGENGTGKSTLLDVFGFLADCLRDGVEAACDKPNRGGFDRLRTQGSTEPIRISLLFKPDPPLDRLTRYELHIDAPGGTPEVALEKLEQPRSGATRGRLFPFLNVSRGKGEVWSGTTALGGTGEAAAREDVELADLTVLGIRTLGQLKDHPRIINLRSYIEGWYLSYFLPDAARTLPPSGPQKHLDRTGTNLANFLQYLERTDRPGLDRALNDIAQRIPGLEGIRTETSLDKRLLLAFRERGYADPFYQRDMSDGTLKVFAYLVLLADPDPHPFIGLEEPENGLYHKLLAQLASEFRRHAEQGGRTQLLVTTHSPWFVDRLAPEQVWVLRKIAGGFSTATRAADIGTIRAQVQRGVPLGHLWYSNQIMNELELSEAPR